MPTALMAQLAFNFTMPNGDDAAVIRHVEWASAPDAADFAALGNEMKQWWDATEVGVTGMKTACVSSLVLKDVTITALAGAPALQHVESVNIAGTQPGDAPPNESSVVSTWYTGFPGRSFRGRSFWPGWATVNLSSAGVLEPAAVTVYQEKFDRLTIDINTAPSVVPPVHCVYSRLLDVMTPVTSVVARNVLHHQSRRNG